MKKHRLSLGLLSALIGTLAAVDTASAVHLSNNGIGQALVYPYYTVNAQQQTLLSVVNSGGSAKAVKVRFREGYNGRSVMEFDLFLSPYDVWTATVFALGDAGLSSDGAAILTEDRSCTVPAFSEDGTSLPSGRPYVAFREFGYLVPNDGGPYTIDRTREGHFEIIAMADLSGPLAAAVTHTFASGVPANCAAVRNLVAGQAGINPPSSGLFGSAGIINVPNGTYFGYDADALERFTATALYSNTAQTGFPDLGAVNDGSGALASQATALVVTPDGATLSSYPGADPRSRRIDAVSAVFAAESVYNEYQASNALAANTDWVVTFPTKAHYVDQQLIGGAVAIPPFTRIYDGSAAFAGSCTAFGSNIYDREERTTGGPGGGFGIPPPPPPPPTLCRQINILSFLDITVAPTRSGALQSRLVSNIRPVVGAAGWLRVNLNAPAEPHALLAASNGNVFRGLPVTGFAAISITNNQATTINGVSTLSNYSSTTKHKPTGKCVNGGGGCQ